MNVETYELRGTAERFLRIDVDVLDLAAAGDWRSRLDRIAAEAIRSTIGTRAYRAVAALVRVSWRDAESRAACVADQRGCPGVEGSRWDDVERYAGLLRAGRRPPSGPVYLDPALTGSELDLLRPIDGARRTMAAAEVGLPEIEAVVILPADRSER